MQAAIHVVDLDIPAILTALALLAGALGIGARGRRRTRREMHTKTDEIMAGIAPTNGAESFPKEVKEQFDDLRENLRQTSFVLEANAITLRMMSEREDHLVRTVAGIDRKVDTVDARVVAVEQHLDEHGDDLQRHIEAVEPLTAWVSAQLPPPE